MTERRHEYTAEELGERIREGAKRDKVPDYLKDPAALARRLWDEAERRNRDGVPLPDLTELERDTPEEPDWLLAVLAPRYPGRSLLGRPEPLARNALRTLVRQEVEDALSLVKSLPPARLTRWAANRVCGPEPLPEEHRRAFFTLVAEVIRAVRESAAAQTVACDRSAGHTTFAALARDTALDTIASQESEAALGLARVSQKLEARFPDLGEVLLLSCYAGLPPDEVANLTRQTVTALKEQLADASDWVLAQTV